MRGIVDRSYSFKKYFESSQLNMAVMKLFEHQAEGDFTLLNRPN